MGRMNDTTNSERSAEAKTSYIVGNAMVELDGLPERSFHCGVTSIPYWGQRKYLGNQFTVFGGSEHEHSWIPYAHGPNTKIAKQGSTETEKWPSVANLPKFVNESAVCEECTAEYMAFGMEPEPFLYVKHVVMFFKKVWRVLRDDGVFFLNIGDTHIGAGPPGGASRISNPHREMYPQESSVPTGFKRTDKAMMPHRVAIALQDSGWYIKQDIVWAKAGSLLGKTGFGNVKPENVFARPTTSHEYIFELSKKPTPFYDAYSCMEASKEGGMKNLKSVWVIPVKGEKEASGHYASYNKKIPELCIKLGTSEHGVCSVCGNPWKRTIEKIRLKSVLREQEHKTDDWRELGASRRTGNINSGKLPTGTIYKTVGWEPTCTCNAGVVPASVLDPFCGSGTTLVVARLLGRNSVGIDICKEYESIALKRLQDKTLTVSMAETVPEDAEAPPLEVF